MLAGCFVLTHPALIDGKMAMLVKTTEQAVTAARGIPSNRITPILPISNVTGDGLENLRRILYETSPSALFKAGLSASTLATTKSINKEESITVATSSTGDEANTKATSGSDVVEMPIDETYLGWGSSWPERW